MKYTKLFGVDNLEIITLNILTETIENSSIILTAEPNKIDDWELTHLIHKDLFSIITLEPNGDIITKDVFKTTEDAYSFITNDLLLKSKIAEGALNLLNLSIAERTSSFKPYFDIIDQNVSSHELFEQSFLHNLHENSLWDQELFKSLKIAIQECEKCNQTKEHRVKIFNLYSHFTDYLGWHLNTNDGFEIHNLTKDDIRDLKEELNLLFLSAFSQ